MKPLLQVLAGGGLLAVLAAGAHAESCGDLLIVLDRSGSMSKCGFTDGSTKEDVARRVIIGVLAQYSGVPMGLVVFPDTIDNCDIGCSPGRVAVDIADDGAAKIASLLTAIPKACGGTPTGATMQNAVQQYAKWTPGRTHHVLLLTDGVPTCDDGAGCNGRGCSECKNPTRVYDSLRSMCEKQNIRTSVVGFDTTKTDCAGIVLDCQDGTFSPIDLNSATLNRMAQLGGA